MLAAWGVEVRRIRPNHREIVRNKHEDCVAPNLDLAADIVDFISQVDPFYRGHSVPKPLEIGGAWGGDLRVRRVNQISTYEGKNLHEVALLHNNMFFNELVFGLWRHCYWHEVKTRFYSRGRLDRARREIQHVTSIWPEFMDFPPTAYRKSLPQWGFGAPAPGNSKNPGHTQKVLKTMKSAWLFNQLKMIGNAMELVPEEISGVLEIGSGFGGLAELLANSHPLRTILLIDIPLNLTTCYYFLRQSLPASISVYLHSSSESVRNAKTEGSRGIHLIPSCFYHEVGDWAGMGLACNFASFSEMDLETVNYYLEGLPSDVKVLVQVNSNQKKLNTDSHVEVPQDRFSYPKGMKIVQEGPVFTDVRYKASVRIRS